jgi:hypothetical protein
VEFHSIRPIAIKNEKENEDGTMGSPYLNSSETIILSTHNIIVNTVPAEAILTNTRLILVDTRDSQIRPQDISFPAIETVTIGESATADPMLSLSMVTGPGLTQPLGIVFPQAPKTKRIGERDEWAAKLKEYSAAAIQEGGIKPAELFPPWVPGAAPVAEGAAESDAADTGHRNPPLIPRKPRPESSPKNRTVIAIAALVVILAVIALGGYFFAPALLGMTGTPVTPLPTPVITPVITTIATTVPLTSTPAPVTAIVTPPLTVIPTTTSVSIIPQSGVWVQIRYAGNYSGIVGAPGRFANVAGSGDHFYQIPARNETVSATVQKLDNSGNVMTIEFYNEGRLIKSGSIKTPRGTLELFVSLNTP